MGYTNYWNPSKKLKTQTDAFPQLMLDEMTKVVEAYNAKQKKEEMKIKKSLKNIVKSKYFLYLCPLEVQDFYVLLS